MTRLKLFILSLTLLLGFGSGAVEAHFADGRVTRTIVVADSADGVIVYLRSPIPFLFGDVVAEALTAGRPLADPLLRLETGGDAPIYRLVLDRIAAEERRFAARLESVLRWRQNGRDLTPVLLRYRLTPGEPPSPFATGADAALSLAGSMADADPVFGTGYVEAAFLLPVPVAGGPLVVRNGSPPLRLGDVVEVENFIVDTRGNGTPPLTVPGQLEAPVTLDGSALQSAFAFVWQGVLHILAGLDHVLLVVCFTLAAGSLTRLLWTVTGFTVGHTATLIAGFLGLVPSFDLFVPVVETAIAASVLYASLAAVRGRSDTIFVVVGIGLLHGLGFSFVLGEILGPEAPDLMLCLASFNVGVEIGQLAIVGVVLAVRALLGQIAAGALPMARGVTLGAIAFIAAYWVVERSLVFV